MHLCTILSHVSCCSFKFELTQASCSHAWDQKSVLLGLCFMLLNTWKIIIESWPETYGYDCSRCNILYYA